MRDVNGCSREQTHKTNFFALILLLVSSQVYPILAMATFIPNFLSDTASDSITFTFTWRANNYCVDVLPCNVQETLRAFFSFICVYILTALL